MRRRGLALICIAMALVIGRWPAIVTAQTSPQIDLSRVAGHDAWKNGAAIYLQSRADEERFDRTFFIKGYRHDGVCVFGCHVTWTFRSLPLGRWTAVTDPVARTFATLERELGWPTLQGALSVAASGANPDPIAAMSDATGRDLAPVFAAATMPSDPAITGVSSSSASCATPCFHTQVSLARGGPLPFPLPLRVSFADGKQIETAWQGRDRVAFESAAPAVAVRLDPDRVWLLDRNPLNNARLEPKTTNVPIVKWAARWITWLQDAMLTRTFPV
ncbi:MAG: hypothetical protein K2Y23_04860 [Cyanobacteria bacterium]|nr:hypothetical protein [Cyanobacteriota bacterium]